MEGEGRFCYIPTVNYHGNGSGFSRSTFASQSVVLSYPLVRYYNPGYSYNST